MKKEEIVFSAKDAKSKEQAISSAKTFGIGNLSIKRQPNIDDCEYLIEHGFKWGYEYCKKEMEQK